MTPFYEKQYIVSVDTCIPVRLAENTHFIIQNYLSFQPSLFVPRKMTHFHYLQVTVAHMIITTVNTFCHYDISERVNNCITELTETFISPYTYAVRNTCLQLSCMSVSVMLTTNNGLLNNCFVFFPLFPVLSIGIITGLAVLILALLCILLIGCVCVRRLDTARSPQSTIGSARCKLQQGQLHGVHLYFSSVGCRLSQFYAVFIVKHDLICFTIYLLHVYSGIFIGLRLYLIMGLGLGFGLSIIVG